MPIKIFAPRIVVLKADRLYGDLICRQIIEYWRAAQVQVFQRGFDALDAIQSRMPDMFVTGVQIEDMDGLEHLEPFIERELPILIVTTRRDARTLALLREIRYNGLFDVRAEGLTNLHTALQRGERSGNLCESHLRAAPEEAKECHGGRFDAEGGDRVVGDRRWFRRSACCGETGNLPAHGEHAP